MREVSRGKLSDEDVEEKFKERLRNLPVNIQDAKGLEEFDFLKAYTQKKAEAWEKIIHILKSYLFYNKHNMRDVIDCLMYIAGLKHVQLVVIFGLILANVRTILLATNKKVRGVCCSRTLNTGHSGGSNQA